MKTKYSLKTTVIAIPRIINLLIHEMIFMARDKALQHELADLRGLICEDYYEDEDLELLRSLESPLFKFLMEAVDTLWTIRHDFNQLNGFDVNGIPGNALAEELADNLTSSFLASTYTDKETARPDYRISDEFPIYFHTAPHVLYETAILLMTGETSMGDPEYGSVAWEMEDDMIFRLDRSDKNLDQLATAMEMLFIWESRYFELEG